MFIFSLKCLSSLGLIYSSKNVAFISDMFNFSLVQLKALSSWAEVMFESADMFVEFELVLFDGPVSLAVS